MFTWFSTSSSTSSRSIGSSSTRIISTSVSSNSRSSRTSGSGPVSEESVVRREDIVFILMYELCIVDVLDSISPSLS